MSPPRRSSIVCIPVTKEGFVDPRRGRTDRVAAAEVTANTIEGWQEFDVGWGQLHDSGTRVSPASSKSASSPPRPTTFPDDFRGLQ